MVKSDGGSSSYYEIDLPPGVAQIRTDGSVRIEVKDIIRHALGNDFDKGNILKALVRVGLKEGVGAEYDLYKNVFFTVDMLASLIGKEATKERLDRLILDLLTKR